MSTDLVLTTINAPHTRQLSAQELAAGLRDSSLWKAVPGHMSSFFGEVDPALQLDFAHRFGISSLNLRPPQRRLRRTPANLFALGVSSGTTISNSPGPFWVGGRLFYQVNSAVGHRELVVGRCGTALMLRIDHRESRDIDIFLSDAQHLAFLDPAKRDFRFEVAPSGELGDGSRFLSSHLPACREIRSSSLP